MSPEQITALLERLEKSSFKSTWFNVPVFGASFLIDRHTAICTLKARYREKQHQRNRWVMAHLKAEGTQMSRIRLAINREIEDGIIKEVVHSLDFLDKHTKGSTTT